MKRLALLLIAGCAVPTPPASAPVPLETPNPDSLEALLERSRRLRIEGRIPEADADLARARKKGAGLAERFYNAGVLETNLRRHAEAERLFAYAADLDPGLAQAHVGLGRIHLELRRFPEAAGALGRAIELRPADAELRLHRGHAFLAQELHDRALEDFDRALALDPELAAARTGRGIVLFRHARDFEKAEMEFGAVLAVDPDHYAARLNRGLLYHEMKSYAEAERDLRKALSLFATAEGTQSLGRVLLDRGDPARAVDAFQKALEVCRDDALRLRIEQDLARAREAAAAKEKTP